MICVELRHVGYDADTHNESSDGAGCINTNSCCRTCEFNPTTINTSDRLSLCDQFFPIDIIGGNGGPSTCGCIGMSCQRPYARRHDYYVALTLQLRPFAALLAIDHTMKRSSIAFVQHRLRKHVMLSEEWQ